MGFVRDYIKFVKVRNRLKKRMLPYKIEALNFADGVLNEVKGYKDIPTVIEKISDMVISAVQKEQ